MCLLSSANVAPMRGVQVFQTTASLTAGASTPGSTNGRSGCAGTFAASTESVARSNRSAALIVSRFSEIVSPPYTEL